MAGGRYALFATLPKSERPNVSYSEEFFRFFMLKHEMIAFWFLAISPKFYCAGG